MSEAEFQAKIRQHLTKFLPKKARELMAAGTLNETVQMKAKQAQARMLELMQTGYQAHEAEEVALKEFVYEAPEKGAGLELWEKMELNKLDRLHRKAGR